MHLNHNVLQVLPETICKLKKLEIFSIWGNQLRILPKNINKGTAIQVHLSTAPIKTIGRREVDTSNLKFKNKRDGIAIEKEIGIPIAKKKKNKTKRTIDSILPITHRFDCLFST